MALFDDIRKKAEDLAEDHGDKIADGIDKAAGLAEKKTAGKHTDKIETGAEKAKDLVEKLAADARKKGGGPA
jgi:hypothetical protein